MYLKVESPNCPWPRVSSKFTETEDGISEENISLAKTEEQEKLIVQLQQQVQLSNLLNQINNEVRRTLDLEEVLNSACRLLGEALKCSRTSILVKESEEEESLVTRGEYNAGEYSTQLGMKVPICDNAHLQTLICQDRPLAVTKFADFSGLGEETREIIKTLRIRSMLAVATRYQGRVNGIIGLQQCDREREWTEWEQQLIEGVASQLAIAINQAKLYAETRRQAECESLLRLVSNQIRSTLDVKTILQTAVREVRQLLNTDRVVIYQFKDKWEGEIVVEDLIIPWPSIFGDSISDNCFSQEYAQHYLEGRVRAINDIQKAGLDRCHVDFLTALQVKSNLIVPIVICRTENSSLEVENEEKEEDPRGQRSKPSPSSLSSSRLWGLMIAQECQSIRHWQLQETELLRQLGEQMAIAIQQAELYAEVQLAAVKSQAQAQKLQTTLEELRSTQQQLIQSEKMSSLGQMVAGVAHEINNANNFIHVNLFHAQEYAKTLSEAIEICANSCPEAAATVIKLEEEFELDYIRQDFPTLLKSMQEGSDRIRSIVTTLRNFSRLDESQFKPANLNQGLESSLAMLQNRLKNGIEIQKEYGDLPLLECNAAQINQVFFHLLQNALDAILTSGKPGKVTICTESADKLVTISIRDSGVGISPEIQNQIFDPFFTTKPVGKGTGLGLSICYQAIVKDHGGTIRCYSKVGEGTEFVVQLPLATSE
ncbi:GAF domain-containing protein [Kamptonema sp. UHCC 0994]|uniref:GAF domain-containing sensor histidine kinase n=1 Tax=Kamptonema sp. UHCC 0994 TaxID=3031329 RepID=UPI0023B952C2|nr:GAF domain-containing protein [Kamptonema sp. UHCC 0994]MDF0552379.1 GAF domain-containing protein [Kamptonema sp. UHCC 0994]